MLRCFLNTGAPLFIQWAVAQGESVTGTTTMRIDQGLDTGDILLQRSLPIEAHQTAEDLFPLLANSGASLMLETLEGLEAGRMSLSRRMTPRPPWRRSFGKRWPGLFQANCR